ncbi:hypothetical protein D3C84_979270 [compost metagenome]
MRLLARLATGAMAVSVEPTPLSPPALCTLSTSAAYAGNVASCSVCTTWNSEASLADGGPRAIAGIFRTRPLSWAIGTPWRWEIFCSSSLRMST